MDLYQKHPPETNSNSIVNQQELQQILPQTNCSIKPVVQESYHLPLLTPSVLTCSYYAQGDKEHT